MVRLNLLLDRIGDTLCLSAESRAFAPSHPLQHLEAQIVVRQLVLRVVRLVEFLAAFHGLELKVRQKLIALKLDWKM